MIQQAKVRDFDSGIAMVVTDLHGNGAAYEHIRDIFLGLHAKGEADHLIICGDLIHGYGDEADDKSLEMLLDVMRLQSEIGEDTITLLMGNHEMPHIYGITLSKGNQEFTPRFERALSRLDAIPDAIHNRTSVMNFVKSLPFYARTKAGVLITHAGASMAIKSAQDAEILLNFDHDDLLKQGTEYLHDYDAALLKSNPEYLAQSQYYLAVRGEDDPRFTDFLRGQLIAQNSGRFQFLWDVLFASNELGWSVTGYTVVAQSFLEFISEVSPYEQRVLIAGHIGVQGGYAEIGPYHFRLASHRHAHPNKAGCYLLLDCEKPSIKTASALKSGVRKVFA